MSDHEDDPTSEAMLSGSSPYPGGNHLTFNLTSSNDTDVSIRYRLANNANNASEHSPNASTFKPEQQNSEYYTSYDPSLGLHTAAVLGGILVWLVLYVIYRTKIRKCIIRAMKRKFGSLDDFSPKNLNGINDSDINSSSGATNPNATRPLINPSIVIETSPPESSPKSPSTYDQFFKPGGGNDCLSPHSLPGGVVNEDGMIFQFPCVHNHHSNYHCTDQHDLVQHQPYHLQLPKSEMDIPNATAQWVQSMPLAARSYQDLAGLMLNIHNNQGCVNLSKPCSCPHVCDSPITQLPVLDMPCSWNNSLPVLSNSFSNRFLDAYEPINNHKDVKDLINAKRKLSYSLKSEQDSLNGKILQKLNSNRLSLKRDGKLSRKNDHRQSGKKKSTKNPANLTIKIPDSKETATLINNNTFSRSPIPIPVTPTVMIQNTTKTPNRRRGCNDSNTSISSSSSNDLLPGASNLQPPIHITVSDPSQNNAYHHLSAVCSDRLRGAGCPQTSCFEASKENVNVSNQGRIAPCYSPYHFIPSHCQCSFKNSRNDNGRLVRQNSTGECRYSQKKQNNDNFLGGYPSSVFHHRRSMSDYNNRHGLLNPTFHQRSLSADIYSGGGFQRDQNSSPVNPPHSNSNKNSPVTTAPSPNLLQVPDINSGVKERPFFLEVNPSPSVYSSNNSLYPSNNNNTGSQYCLRHGGTSDSNIAYYRGSHRPVSPLVDIPKDRRHSSIVTGSTGSQLLYCSDINPRPMSSSSSSYFLPLQGMPLSPTCPPHHTPQTQPQMHSPNEQEQRLQQPEQHKQQQQQQQQQQQHELSGVAPLHQNRSNNSCNVTVSRDATTPNQNLGGTPVVTKSVMMETKL